MEFDHINCLINIERARYQNDLATGKITMQPHNNAVIDQNAALQSAMDLVKKCTIEVAQAQQRLEAAMRLHTTELTKAYRHSPPQLTPDEHHRLDTMCTYSNFVVMEKMRF